MKCWELLRNSLTNVNNEDVFKEFDSKRPFVKSDIKSYYRYKKKILFLWQQEENHLLQAKRPRLIPKRSRPNPKSRGFEKMIEKNPRINQLIDKYSEKIS